VVGQDEVYDAAAQSGEDRLIARRAANFAGSVGGLKFDAALAEIAHSFGPDGPPEVTKLFRRTARTGIHDSMDGHQEARLGAGAAGNGRRCPDELPPRHFPLPDILIILSLHTAVIKLPVHRLLIL
jgi:hypothetical protein